MIAQNGISRLGEANDIKVQLTYLTKINEDLISTKSKSVRGMLHADDACSICDLKGHITLNYPSLLAFKKAIHE